MFFATLIIFILSIFVCNEVIKDLKVKDHKAIVIDEATLIIFFLGMWIALFYEAATYLFDSMEERITYAISALIFFRFFDILKVFPIYLIDRNLKNAFGIVLDDAIAGLFCNHSIIFNTLFSILDAVSPHSSSISSLDACSIKLSGIPKIKNLGLKLCLLQNSCTAEPAPPAIQPSSRVITKSACFR